MRPIRLRYVLTMPALILLAAGALVICSGGGGSSAATRGGEAAWSGPTRADASVRPLVEAEIAKALEAEGAGAGLAECAARSAGSQSSLGQLARMHQEPAYAWRWAWKEATGCLDRFKAGETPYA